MNILKRFVQTVAMPILLSLSSCSNASEVDTLFRNVIDKKQIQFSYNDEIFEAVITSPTNNARITLIGNKWNVITIHNAIFSFDRVKSNTIKDPEQVIENLQAVE